MKQHSESGLRLTGRTISTTKRGPFTEATTTEHYAVVDVGGATDEELTSLITELQSIRALVRQGTNTNRG